ncbi:MAG: S8/S53 family peptidase [Acidobacteriaceae bacterium]|nr:S8/S53 family peptidase [Acidobacteriaceae bacterium]MBV9779671.1 S8/S53 family peptidase [Acidobacteriaceae bacterium]
MLLVHELARPTASLPGLITSPIDERQLVTLAGNTRPEANVDTDHGRVADGFRMEHVLLQLKRSPKQELALRAFIDELHNPASANFHHWLSADEFGKQFGLAQPDLDVIERWLVSHGFQINVVYSNRQLIDFSGTAGQIRAALHTEIHRLMVNGEEHIANMSDPQIPAALAPAVAGPVSLHNFMPQPLREPHAGYTFVLEKEKLYGIVPGDLATIYNLTPLFEAGDTGKGQTIAVVEVMDIYNSSDWNTFRSTFGLASYTSGSLTTIHPAPKSGNNNCADPGYIGSDAEAVLDAEWASAAAPDATIELASCATTTTSFGALIAVQNLINGTAVSPDIISISYGACEANSTIANSAYSSAFQQAVAQGVSVYVAAGDSGAACNYGSVTGIAVNGIASTAYNVAVGGTDFGDTYSQANSAYWNSNNSAVYASAKSYVPEIPWNDTCASVLLAESRGYKTTYGEKGFCNSDTGARLNWTHAGGGGPSNCATFDQKTCGGWPKPSWQASVGGISNDGVRDLPDISLFAGKGMWDHLYVYCDSAFAPCTDKPDTWSYDGGTSFGSPIMAGIQALVNEKVGERQGNPNYMYYKLAAEEYGAKGSKHCDSSNGRAVAESCTFHDITMGDNDVACSENKSTGNNNCFIPSGETGVLSLSSDTYQPAFEAGIGWDFATGIGTVNAYNLVNNWASVISKSATLPDRDRRIKLGWH